MAHLARLTAGLWPLAVRVRRWPVDSQRTSRRNAMLACTALAAVRAERDEVADLLLAHSTPPATARPRRVGRS